MPYLSAPHLPPDDRVMPRAIRQFWGPLGWAVLGLRLSGPPISEPHARIAYGYDRSLCYPPIARTPRDGTALGCSDNAASSRAPELGVPKRSRSVSAD
jgi:hypothetical protein